MNTIEITGSRIQSMRKQRGLTQEELAHLIKKNSNLLARWERGEVKLKTETITKIAHALGTSSSYLLGETDNPEDLHSEVVDIANNSWQEDLQEPISGGFNTARNQYAIHDGNTNKTYYMPNDADGRRIFLEALYILMNGKSPEISNTIHGNNNNGNKLGIINN